MPRRGQYARKAFWYSIEYYSSDGKFRTRTKYEYETLISIGSLAHPRPNMNNIAAHIRGLRDCGGQGSLPGLSLLREGWSGLIRIKPIDAKGDPVIIMPERG